MTEKKKTICVGRFLVDVPAQALLSLRLEMMDGFEIETVEESEAAFRERMAAREADIAARGSATDGSGGLVAVHELRIPGMIGKTLVYGLNRGYYMSRERRVDDEFVSVEAHAHISGLSYLLSAHYADADGARTKQVEALLERLRPRGKDEVPLVPGFCIGRAVFAEPLPQHKTEHIVMHIGLPDHPDLGITFVSTPGGRSGSGLLARVADTDAEASVDEMLRVSKLREGKRSINGFAGEENLERVREPNFATTFGFTWETRGVENDPLHPFLSLELHAGISPRPGGKPADSSLHEDAVLALWDSISSSIRLRKSGSSSASAVRQEAHQPVAMAEGAGLRGETETGTRYGELERRQFPGSGASDIRRVDYQGKFNHESIPLLAHHSIDKLK